jgi:exodeoxyribonuclease (lambda-induced)
MGVLKTGAPSKECLTLIAEIVAERMTGDTTEHFVTGAMQRGLDLEPDALAEYQFRTGYALEPGGLVVHPELPQVAATPDGFVACAGGLVETKCPSNRTKHLAALLRAHDAADGFAATLKSVCPAVEYGPQVQWQMWVTGRPWVDLVSYDPRWPGDQCLAVLRVEADPEMHERFAERVAWAEAQVSEAIGAMA